MSVRTINTIYISVELYYICFLNCEFSINFRKKRNWSAK